MKQNPRKKTFSPLLRGIFVLLLAAGLIFAGWQIFFWRPSPYLPTVALLPLDSRPVNQDLPRQLAALGGLSLTLPPADMLDQFLTPSQPEPLLGWLQTQQKEKDLVIAHVNELLFGGLINSREESQYQDSQTKLNQLQDLLQAQRQAQQQAGQSTQSQTILIYILPRLLPSQYDLTLWQYEKELPAYSQLKHQLALDPHNQALSRQLEKLTLLIPREILERYENLYRQAQQVGETLLDWSQQGLVAEVIIGLDDAAPRGLNVQVFQSLQQEAAQRGLTQAFFLHGADELAPLVMARHALPPTAKEGWVPLFLTPADQQTLFPYEAISLGENFQEKLLYLTYPTNREVNAGSSTKYLIFNTSQTLSPGDMDQAWQQIAALKRDHRPDTPQGQNHRPPLIGLADVAKVNGAFKPFVDRVGLGQIYHYVDAYAGWNTAGNSLGTVLAHLLFLENAQTLKGQAAQQARQAHEALQRLRLIDDYIFQSSVRPELTQWALAEGFPYLTFGDHWPQANSKLQELMEEALAPYPSLLPAASSSSSASASYPYEFSFPWPRSFEIWIQPTSP